MMHSVDDALPGGERDPAKRAPAFVRAYLAEVPHFAEAAWVPPKVREALAPPPSPPPPSPPPSPPPTTAGEVEGCTAELAKLMSTSAMHKSARGVSTQLSEEEFQLSLQATAESLALATKLQGFLDSDGFTRASAARVVRCADEAFSSGHVKMNLRLEGCLGRVKDALDGKGNFTLEHTLKGLVAACRNEDHPDRSKAELAERRDQVQSSGDSIQQLAAALKQIDPEIQDMRRKILAEEKLTPSKTQKILKPFKGRMDPAYFADLLESVQAKPSEFRQAKRREDFVDAIINGIVHRSLQEPNGVQSLFKLDGLQA